MGRARTLSRYPTACRLASRRSCREHWAREPPPRRVLVRHPATALRTAPCRWRLPWRYDRRRRPCLPRCYRRWPAEPARLPAAPSGSPLPAQPIRLGQLSDGLAFVRSLESPVLWCRAGWYTAGLLPKTGTYRPFLPINSAVCASIMGIKLSSGGTLAIFFSQKYDIALITPMTKLAILEYPDPRLRKTAAPVGIVDDAVRQLAADLLETMYAAKG